MVQTCFHRGNSHQSSLFLEAEFLLIQPLTSRAGLDASFA
ncbi:hypothetical protein SZ55_2735 [Pseudomonas sp. FeS53a]|nr:hypothetical protein SZ55_2735 [Pseudomonas sp. FeS53a]